MRTGPRLEPRYKEVLRQNVLAIPRFRYIEVLFHIFYYYWGKEDCSLYPGLCYIEVRYIKVPQYTLKKLFCRNASSPPPPPHKNKSTHSLNYRARSIQPKFLEILVQNSVDPFGPTGKVSKNWSTFCGRPLFPVGPVGILVAWIVPVMWAWLKQ